MNEHPILFSTPMVQANLEGRKTNTRRMTGLDKVNKDPDNWESIGTYHVITKGCFEVCFEHKKTKEKIYCHAQYGLPGDLLWVRESFGLIDHPELKYRYKADHLNPKSVNWNPSIHMPKVAARIWLQIEEIRVERLNDISEEDAMSEGVQCIRRTSGYCWMNYIIGECVYPSTAKYSFMTLWKKINGQESWDANPWVWVVKYKVLSTTGKPENIQ